MSDAEFKAIRNLFEGKANFELLHEAKEHEFGAKAFHTNCDNKGPTLVVAKSEHESIFGWFTTIEWKSGDGWVRNALG